jgi:hypothetical protein
MAKQKYQRPVLTIIEPDLVAPTIFEMLDANQIINKLIDDVLALRKRLLEKEGIILEALNYTQGFLETSRERLAQLAEGVELIQSVSEIAGRPGVCRIIETEADLAEQTDLMTVREEVDLLEEESQERKVAPHPGSEN